MTDPKSLLRKLPILLILGAAGVGAVFLHDQFSFETLARNRDALIGLRSDHYFAASIAFVLIYTVIVGLSLPGATVATLTGGFMFGVFPGVIFNVTAATLGAIAIFLAAKIGFGASVANKITSKGGAAARLQSSLQENEWSALLVMRLVPAVPFFLANLIPAFVGTRLVPFAVTTFFGIIPATFVFTSIGAGLGEVFARGETPDLGLIFAPQILLPILGLAALSALPILIKSLRRKVN